MTNPTNPDDAFRSVEPRDVAGNIFSIGDPNLSHEVFQDGQRYFYWLKGDDDDAVATTAGWEDLRISDSPEGYGRLIVPAGTRSASTVLAGMEAWNGEKQAVLEQITTYQKKVFALLGMIDLSASFDTVGVTKEEGKAFITPPHMLSADMTDAQIWAEGIIRDLHNILGDDPDAQELIEDFTDDSGRIVERN